MDDTNRVEISHIASGPNVITTISVTVINDRVTLRYMRDGWIPAGYAFLTKELANEFVRRLVREMAESRLMTDDTADHIFNDLLTYSYPDNDGE